MATINANTQAAQASNLCDYCHQKPKFSNHLYCSKTCAGQAATLCSHCHKKPKFQNFEYCGKNCAALANPGGKPRNPTNAAASQPAGNAKQVYQKGQNANNAQQPAAPVFDPVQLAKLVAQHLPQVQSLVAPNSQAAVQPPAGPAGAGGILSQVLPANHPSNNPFLDPTTQVQTGMSNGAVKLTDSSHSIPAAQPLHISTQTSADDLECLIPGCGQPVHVDAKGMKSSEYCSMRHREEAVTSGLVSPCIMCLVLPQSEADYFCSRVCREESMRKQLDCDEYSE